MPVPHTDWDRKPSKKTGDLKHYSLRHEQVAKEMKLSYAVSLVVTIVMMIPLWFTGQCSSQFIKIDMDSQYLYIQTLAAQVLMRHNHLAWTIGTKDEEDISSEAMKIVLGVITPLSFVLFAMESGFYYVYHNKVIL